MRTLQLIPVLSLLFSSACIAQEVGEVETAVRDNSVDKIQPIRITHHVDEIFEGEQLVQHYNFLVYEFSDETGYISARVYVDGGSSVAIYGPFRSTSDNETIEAPKLINATIEYFKRRYMSIERFDPEHPEIYYNVWRRELSRYATQQDLSDIEKACGLPAGSFKGQTPLPTSPEAKECMWSEAKRSNLLVGFISNPVDEDE